jgi:hypothetical protein
MTAIWKFRLLSLLVVLFVGAVSISNLVAEFLRSARPTLPSGTGTAPTSEQVSSAVLASTIAPFRSDLAADRALVLAAQVLKSEAKGQSEKQDDVQSAVKAALRIGPHDSQMWLLLALFQARSNPADPSIAESLKMSYLTGPNRAELIPIRLDAVTANNALSDSDLGELARSDVRALLTQLSQRGTLLYDYLRASQVGKKFLEESIGTVDPGFVVTLRGTASQ